jgi:hypothetical protein
MKLNILVIFLVVTIIIPMASCGKKTITGAERETVLNYANPAADSILEGFNNGDYARYSLHFDEQMKNALPVQVFTQTREAILLKIGKYKSRELSDVYTQNQYTVVVYRGNFEAENNVEIKIIFQKLGDKILVSGLWFNSPKLRK